MIKPQMLKKGDKVAIVSLSWGGLGDEDLIHKYYIAKERLENDFGLEVVAMPNALKGTDFVYEHPELRAKDLMDAFKDTTIKGIFSAIGGDDSIRMLPYIDYDVIRKTRKFLWDINVVLDWGFWTKEERQSVKEFYKSRDIECEFHYIDISDETWKFRLNKRNIAVLAEETSAYYVDENLASKFASIFEVPGEDEIDVACQGEKNE